MLKSLQELMNLNTNEASNDPKMDVKLAAATLMFELVRADGEITQEEISHMKALLIRQFALDDESLQALFEVAEQNSKEAISLHGFTREICEQWDNTKRAELLENLWLLALSDEVIDPHERHLVRKIASLLYLNESEIIQTREQAKQRLGING